MTAERDQTTGWRIDMQMMPRCICGRIVSTAKPHGWFMFGEYGSEEGYICQRCLPTWTPCDGRGRGPEAGYCGVKQ